MDPSRYCHLNFLRSGSTRFCAGGSPYKVKKSRKLRAVFDIRAQIFLFVNPRLSLGLGCFLLRGARRGGFRFDATAACAFQLLGALLPGKGLGD